MNIKQNASFIVPSKTFLVGEYLALEQHCGMVINTQPCFELTISAEQPFLFSKNSPADIFFQEHEALFRHSTFTFVDPYHESGGFGASSAQFVALAMLKKFLENHSNTLSEQDIQDIHQSYLSVIEKNNSRASGIDVVGQCLGQIAIVDCKHHIYQSHPWPFEQLSLLLFKTPFKIRTHEHVSNVKHIPINALNNIFDETKNTFLAGDQDKFLLAVQHYAHVLQQHDLILKEISNFCFLLSRKFPNAVSKGCGALGADVVLVLIDKQQKNDIKKWIEQYEMTFIADEDSLSKGVSLKT